MFSVLLAITLADKQSIELPIKSKHDLEIIKTPSEETEHNTYVDVPGGVLPVYMTFKTQSSPLFVKQEHKGTKGSYQKSDSKDEPHKLVHEVVKPVIQELKEIITPYRKVVQIIEKVNEERQTKVHKGERKNGYEGNDNGYGTSEGYGKNDGYTTYEGYATNEGYGKTEEYAKKEDDLVIPKLEDLYKKYGMSY